VNGPFLVGIAGGSGSGKSTLAHALRASLGPERVAIVAHDGYYRDRGHLEPQARERLNYDVPEAFDAARFVADLRRLREGLAIDPPSYCFVTHRRLGHGPRIEPRDVVLVEGILLLHDPDVRAALDLTIFVDAPAAVRFARRMARDTGERGRTAESVIQQYATTVSVAHVEYVEPTKALADLVLLNSGPLAAVVEVASTVIRDHLRRRQEERSGARRALA
jgi:uridine kinase